MMKKKILIALTAAFIGSTVEMKAAALTVPPGRRGLPGHGSDDTLWAFTHPGQPDSATAATGDDGTTAKAEVMKKKKKKKKKSKPS